MAPVYIQSYSALRKTGMYSSAKGHVSWHEDQSGAPLDVQRKQVYEKLHTGFGKLNAPDKLAFSAAALALAGCNEYNGNTTGICVGTAYGSLSTDMRYMESLVNGFPSPSCFAATLPSSPVAEVAIQFKLKGPNRVIVNSVASGFPALESAIRILSAGKAEAMLTIVVNGLEPVDTQLPFIPVDTDNNYSYAFLLTVHHTETGCNYNLSLTHENNKQNNSRNRSEESYFYNMLSAMMENGTYSNTINLDNKQYTISIKKE